VLAVRNNGGDVAATSRQLGIPDRTLRQWVDGDRQTNALILSDAYRGDLAAAFRDAAWMFLRNAVGKADKAPFNHLMTGVAIAFEKMRLMNGQSTVNAESRNLNVHVEARELVGKMDDEQFNALVALLDSAGCTATGGAGETVQGEVPALPRGGVPDVGEEPAD